ncbi:NUDIX domain-containing protein [Candidatus Curtissbacteria bacterium]|nr:NUDIX domain-containing protein [Candidatus Curtissbacteria bacterium]
MAVKRIFSAGGIIFRESSKGPNGTEVLVTQHSGHKGWDFPKGHIESGESAEAAALREVEEETGVKAKIIERVGDTKYFYFDAGERVFKIVIFFLMKYVGEGKATTAFEVSAMEWLPVEVVEEKLTFKDTKKLWGEAKEKIEQLTTDI